MLDPEAIIARTQELLAKENLKPLTPSGIIVLRAICEALNGQQPKRGPRMKRPGLDEIKLQAAKCGLPEEEAEKFFAFYESKGWMVGKNPMKNWKIALCVTWKKGWEAKGRPVERVSLYTKLATAKELLAKAEAFIRSSSRPHPMAYDKGEQSRRYQEDTEKWFAKLKERKELAAEVERLQRQMLEQ